MEAILNLGENYRSDIRRWVGQRSSKLESCDKASLNPLAGSLEAFWENQILFSSHAFNLLLMDLNSQVFLPKEEG